MKEEDDIKITSGQQKELSTKVVIGGKRYLVITEDLGTKKHLITTRVYLGGEIISVKKIDYENILNASGFEKKLRELMLRHHELAITMFKAEKMKKEKVLSDYFNEIKTLLQKKNHKSALKLLAVALERYPDEPFLLSYYGCLEAIVNKNYTHGIVSCSRAIEIFRERIPFGQEFFYPVFYLNLGRAYLAARNKKAAVEAFHIGLSYDNEHTDLLWEIRKLGIRKKPVVSFLPRSNPINKYIGMMLHKLRKT